MTILQNFTYNNINVRTVLIEGEPWFVAKDLCKILGISNVSQALSRLTDDEKGICSNDTLGGKQEMAVVSESGMYALVLRSRKPEAEPFRKWVTAEVLPSIRKTGKYSVTPEVPAIAPRDTVEYIEAAAKLECFQESTLKRLLQDCLIDELELRRNQKALPGGAEKKRYTIVKVRAKQLGYDTREVGSGTALGRFVHSRIKPAYQEMVGRFPVYHYEITPELDTAIHTFFGATQTELLLG